MRRGIQVFLLLLLLPANVEAADLAATPRCETPAALLDLGQPLPHVAARIARGEAVTVVAFGSSSTQGAGASDAAHAYPAQLARLWPRYLGIATVKMVNRGIGGETIDDMRKRLRRDVTDLKPDLILWQLGTNAVLRSDGIGRYAGGLRQAVAELKAGGADVVLIDLQYAPKVLRDPDHAAMEALLRGVAAELQVGLFQRFGAMKHWQDSGQLRPADMLAPDGLHMNDTGYGCWAEALARALAGALAPGPGGVPNSAVSAHK
ncbi:MAG TPA: SGNH/GDSL hydrolase family protein [Ferrovibrio sp.]|uniref:SGNH/GDSL hydrolase family protein n=1 Tax=Ferrovibrio sp. TaxID=1917215 RepID=UPI002ED54EC8